MQRNVDIFYNRTVERRERAGTLDLEKPFRNAVVISMEELLPRG